ncbi:MAG TPA: TerC family protein [Streptosporangiaceae bacterium]|jgi:tellurite resistance protein TerC
MTGAPAWAWAASLAVICGLLAIDMLSTRRQPGLSRTVVLSIAWVAAGIGFGLVLVLWQGFEAGQEYFAAYLIEKSLSVDNLFVFAVLFQAFAVPAASQHRVLLAGVAGALVLRGAFIAAGAALIEHLSWTFPLFGGLLLIAALRMARRGAPPDPRRGLVLRGLRKVMPVSDHYDGNRFFTRIDGKRVATPLLVALVAIETTDVIFALDSIPAAFGVTTDPFLVFTSNAFAVLGLRALYFVLAGALERLRYLSLGLAVLLAFIGVKMMVSPVLHIPTAVSLGAIIVIIGVAAGMSMWNRPRVTEDGEAGPHVPAEPERRRSHV